MSLLRLSESVHRLVTLATAMKLQIQLLRRAMARQGGGVEAKQRAIEDAIARMDEGAEAIRRIEESD